MDVAFGTHRTKAYQLAATGEFPVPVLRVGGTYHVPTAELMKTLGVFMNLGAGSDAEAEVTDE